VNATGLRKLLALCGWAGWAVQAWAGPELLVTLERDFAAAVAAQGAKAGFLQYLAPDGLLFRPRPVVGATFFETAPEDVGLLEWAPSSARLAESGDLGFTTGPWRYRASRTNTLINATGQYLTVWRRTEAGWKVALDAGVGGPSMSFPWRVDADGPDDAEEPLAGWQQTQRGRDLKFVEEAYGRRSAREGEASAVEAHGHKRVRVLRPGAPPVVGRTDAVRFLSANTRKTRDAVQGVMISGSGDLGYAWGESELLGSGTTPPKAVRSWARVWRRSGWSGTWRVALDLAIDYP
jgi:ketosteroid isomerase-like protein